VDRDDTSGGLRLKSRCESWRWVSRRVHRETGKDQEVLVNWDGGSTTHIGPVVLHSAPHTVAQWLAYVLPLLMHHPAAMGSAGRLIRSELSRSGVPPDRTNTKRTDQALPRPRLILCRPTATRDPRAAQT